MTGHPGRVDNGLDGHGELTPGQGITNKYYHQKTSLNMFSPVKETQSRKSTINIGKGQSSVLWARCGLVVWLSSDTHFSFRMRMALGTFSPLAITSFNSYKRV